MDGRALRQLQRAEMPVFPVLVFDSVRAERGVQRKSVIPEAVRHQRTPFYIGEYSLPDLVERRSAAYVFICYPVYMDRIFLKIKDFLRRPYKVFAGSHDSAVLHDAEADLAYRVQRVVCPLEVYCGE